MKQNRILEFNFDKIYSLYLQKARNKHRTKDEVDEIICWLTGYNLDQLKGKIEKEISIETFFIEAPKINPNATLIKGVVCGVRVEEIDDSLMQKIRYLDKLIDELAKGKTLDKILRK